VDPLDQTRSLASQQKPAWPARVAEDFHENSIVQTSHCMVAGLPDEKSKLLALKVTGNALVLDIVGHAKFITRLPAPAISSRMSSYS
jgi:hypothetical protein